MRDPLHVSPPQLTEQSLTPTWTLKLGGPVRRLCHAREADVYLVHAEQWVVLVDGQGNRQSQRAVRHSRSPIACSEDGLTFAAVDPDNTVLWLAPDLMPRWKKSFASPIRAIAISPQGEHLAVSEENGAYHLLSSEGRLLWSEKAPRPMGHLAFVPEKSRLIGCADIGLLLCMDLKGAVIWQDRIMSSIGGMSVNGDGSRIQLACYSDGIRQNSLTGPPGKTLPTREPCRLISASYGGDVLLVSGMRKSISILDSNGTVGGAQALAELPSAISFSPFADRAVIGMETGRLLCREWR